MAIRDNLLKSYLEKYKAQNNLVGAGETLFDYYGNKANQRLMTNPAFLNNLLKIQQVRNSVGTNTQNLQQTLSNTQNQIVDASYQAKQKSGKSGLGNTGLGAYNIVDTEQSNNNLLGNIQQTAQSNNLSLDNLDLYSNANVQAIYENISSMINQDRKLNFKDTEGNNILDITGAKESDAYNIWNATHNSVSPITDQFDPKKDTEEWNKKKG